MEPFKGTSSWKKTARTFHCRWKARAELCHSPSFWALKTKCGSWTVFSQSNDFTSSQLGPPLTFYIATVQMYSQYAGWWKPGRPCDLWTRLLCASVCCVTAASWDIATFLIYPILSSALPCSQPLKIFSCFICSSHTGAIFTPLHCSIYRHFFLLLDYSQIFQIFPVVRCLVFASFYISCFLLSIQTIFHPSSTMHRHPALLLHTLFPALHPAHIAPMYEVQGWDLRMRALKPQRLLWNHKAWTNARPPLTIHGHTHTHLHTHRQTQTCFHQFRGLTSLEAYLGTNLSSMRQGHLLSPELSLIYILTELDTSLTYTDKSNKNVSSKYMHSRYFVTEYEAFPLNVQNCVVFFL